MDNSQQPVKKREASKRALKLLSHLEKKGIPKIAKQMGTTASKLYNWKYGAKPNFDALEDIAELVPTIDWNEIFYGENYGKLESASFVETNSERAIKELEAKVAKLVEENRELKLDKAAFRTALSIHRNDEESLRTGTDDESFQETNEVALRGKSKTICVQVDETGHWDWEERPYERKQIGFDYIRPASLVREA